jgi:uncharacterized protein (TIGR04255 family)
MGVLPVVQKPPAGPEFEKPPVIEVVLGVQFSPLAALSAGHMGLLWNKFRKEFPQTQDQPPLPRASERFDKPEPPSFRIEPASMTPRCWFLNQDGTELLQVQQDRFHHNWRKVGPLTGYPRYHKLRGQFAENLRVFEKFMKDERLGEFKPDQCELSYIDHIESGEVWKDFGQTEKVFPGWTNPKSPSFDLVPENITVDVKYLLPGKDGKPAGRLHVKLTPGYRFSDRAPILIMDTTARGTPIGGGVDGTLAFLDNAHDWTIRAFTTLTSDEIRKSWRPKNA